MKRFLALFVFFAVALAQVTDLALLRNRIEQGEFLSAIPKLEAHIKVRPGDAEAFFLLARAYYLATGAVNLAKAEDAIRNCFRQSAFPRAEYHWQRGLIYASSNRSKEALTDLRTASSGDSRASYKEMYRFAMDWGAVAWRIGDLQQALEAYRRAGRTDPSQPLAWLNQGIILVSQSSGSEAESALNKAITLMQANTPKNHPAIPEAYYWRGRAQELQNKLEAARESYRRALEFNSNHGAAKTALENLATR